MNSEKTCVMTNKWEENHSTKSSYFKMSGKCESEINLHCDFEMLLIFFNLFFRFVVRLSLRLLVEGENF
jgi:hypothetical protein